MGECLKLGNHAIETAVRRDRGVVIASLLSVVALAWVYLMCSTQLEPLSKPIDLEIDVENRVGRIVVPGVFETSAEPIRNPVTGNIHRARIDMPEGFEYEIAEIGSAGSDLDFRLWVRSRHQTTLI